MSHKAAILMAVFALGGCGETHEGVDVSRQSIVSGEPSGLEDDAVVHVWSPTGACSGTLIAANLVLTARHCVAIISGTAELACNLDGTSDNAGAEIASDYEPSQISVAPGPMACVKETYAGRRLFSTGSQTTCRNDLAIIELERPLVGWPIMPLRLLRPTRVGESMTLVGYGMSDEVSDGYLRRRLEGMDVLVVGPNRFNESGGSAVAGTFTTTRGGCLGDSGGPAIAEESGAVAGVFSQYTGDDCANPSAEGIFAQVAEYYELVLQAFDVADAEPWLEGEEGPGISESKEAGVCVVTGGIGRFQPHRLGWLCAIALLARRLHVQRKRA